MHIFAAECPAFLILHQQRIEVSHTTRQRLQSELAQDFIDPPVGDCRRIELNESTQSNRLPSHSGTAGPLAENQELGMHPALLFDHYRGEIDDFADVVRLPLHQTCHMQEAVDEVVVDEGDLHWGLLAKRLTRQQLQGAAQRSSHQRLLFGFVVTESHQFLEGRLGFRHYRLRVGVKEQIIAEHCFVDASYLGSYACETSLGYHTPQLLLGEASVT